jgi:hypothetical protein
VLSKQDGSTPSSRQEAKFWKMYAYEGWRSGCMGSNRSANAANVLLSLNISINLSKTPKTTLIGCF